jgi:REP element-mobilizing transposase RayT
MAIKRNCRRCYQLSLDDNLFKKAPAEFGGELLKKSHAKCARPISTKCALHVVLRSTLAKDKLSFLSCKRRAQIENTIRKQAATFNIKIYRLAINSNHVHLLVKFYERESYRMFIRAITGLIAGITLGIKRGKAMLVKFWDYRPYTRIISWGRDFKITSEYVIQNILEATGVVPYKERRHGPG